MNEEQFRKAEQQLWESVGAVPTEQQVRLKRNDVAVRIQEIGEGPPVLFLHAAIASGASWVTLAARLKGLRCLLLDRPGTGLSDALREAPNVETLPEFADTLVVDVLDSLGIDSAHIVSASFGGYFALRTAWAHPDRVARIVHFSCPVGARATRRPPLSMRLTSSPMVRRLITSLPPNRRTLRSMFSRVGHRESLKAGRITPELLDGYVALLRYTDTMRNEMAMGGEFYSARGLTRLALPDDILAEIKTPILFLWGTNDPFGGEDAAHELVDRIPNATLELMEGAGHAAWLDDIDRSAKATMAFLGSK